MEVSGGTQSYCLLLCKQAISVEGQESVVTDYILKVSKNTLPEKEQEKWIFPLTVYVFLLQILGLEICADAMVGDSMIRGISGGQKKRVTTGMCTLHLQNDMFTEPFEPDRKKN